TNGVVPMGAAAVSDEIYDSIIDSAADGATELFHGYTYSACPVACAAGLAALGIYEKEGLFERAGKLSPYFLDAMWSLQGMDVVDDIRGYGLLAGIELKPHPAPSVRGYEALQRLYEKGLLVKVTGDCILLSPPLVISESEIDFMIDTLREVFETL
ncbi:MAG: aminotransferase class III-fold pyridoxal phosphate-dependent enzyme, partial [Alphaproteobacteria bacterium]